MEPGITLIGEAAHAFVRYKYFETLFFGGIFALFLIIIGFIGYVTSKKFNE